MKIGVSLPQATLRNLEELRSFCVTASECGFASLWSGDHIVFPASIDRSLYPFVDGVREDSLFFPEQRWTEAVVCLSAAAASFPQGDLGFAVILPAIRSPVILAKQLAAIDLLSGGRLTVGVGVGWVRQEYAATGVPFAERSARVLETVTLWRALWSGVPTSFKGRFTNFEDVVMRPPPAKGTELRVWYGGNSVKLLGEMASDVSGWIPFEPDLELISRGRDVLAERGARATVGVVTRLPLGDGDLSDARRKLDSYCGAGIDHVIVPASVGRSADDNRRRIERLALLSGGD